MDLFRAGTDTTATTLSWSFMYLAKHQDIQKQVREEIDEVRHYLMCVCTFSPLSLHVDATVEILLSTVPVLV